MSGFVVYPAVDLSGGRAVRLHQGRREALRVVADDPVALAVRLAEEGAAFLHVVDLDAAFGDAPDDATVLRLAAAVPCPVQVGGGVRDEARAARLLDGGAARVVVGTAALRAPALLRRLVGEDPERVVVAADCRGGRVVVAGWTETTGEEVASFARGLRGMGVLRILVTAVERDGTGAGPDHAVLGAALDGFGPGVIASGGVGAVADVAALEPLARRGLAGVVVGSLVVDGGARVDELDAVTEGW